MRVFLVRHGESTANLDKSSYQTAADHVVPLSPSGVIQAGEAAVFLRNHLEGEARRRDPYLCRFPRLRLWVSPYLRARQTADPIEAALHSSPSNPGGQHVDRREHVLLAEQQFGLFDGIESDARAAHFPREHAHYEKFARHVETGGRFWAPMPLGESRFAVCQRVHQAFGTFARDAEKHGIHDTIVVAHATTIRAFQMMWLHHPVEWFEAAPNPKNCSVQLLVNGEDRGVIFEPARAIDTMINRVKT